MSKNQKTELDKDRLSSLGNAVVPQVAEWLGYQIMQTALLMIGKLCCPLLICSPDKGQ